MFLGVIIVILFGAYLLGVVGKAIATIFNVADRSGTEDDVWSDW